MKFRLGKLTGLVCCPSYKRPRAVETLQYLPSIRVYVSVDEHAEYSLHNPKADIHPMPKGVQGNIARVRNWILDHADADIVCIVDDDLQWIGYFERDDGKRVADETSFRVFLQKYTQLAVDVGTPLWGINVNIDKQCYREYTPFSFTSVVLAPFMVHIQPELRFDERLPLKEDYDFCLQTLNQYRKILRVNRFHYWVRQGVSQTAMGQTGGCAAMRSLEEERRQLELLRKKWGDAIVQIDSLERSRSHRSDKEKRFDVNPVIRVPIMGV